MKLGSSHEDRCGDPCVIDNRPSHSNKVNDRLNPILFRSTRAQHHRTCLWKTFDSILCDTVSDAHQPRFNNIYGTWINKVTFIVSFCISNFGFQFLWPFPIFFIMQCLQTLDQNTNNESLWRSHESFLFFHHSTVMESTSLPKTTRIIIFKNVFMNSPFQDLTRRGFIPRNTIS